MDSILLGIAAQESYGSPEGSPTSAPAAAGEDTGATAGLLLPQNANAWKFSLGRSRFDIIGFIGAIHGETGESAWMAEHLIVSPERREKFFVLDVHNHSQALMKSNGETR